jgi:pimeloyl-ACP methyl ester carboxylesterase
VPPDVPEPGPGSIFVATAAGFELDPRLPEETERNDAVQKALHISITRRIGRLRDAIARISNTHPILAAEFADYAVFVGPDLAKLDVASLWSAGSGLSEFVRAFDTQDPSSTITPPLEPETLAEFRALLRDHTAFILGFDTGRKLTERAAALHAVERRPEEIKDAALAVLRPMLNTPRLLAGRAQHLVQSLTRALEDWPAKTFSLLVGSVETGKNSLIAFGRAFEPIILSFAGADLALTLAGVKHADTLRAAALFLHDNCDAVTAFIASDPQLTEWLLWLIERSRRLVTPLSTKNNLDLPRTQESPAVVGSPAFAQTGSEDNRVFPVRHSLREICGLIQAGLVRGDPPQRVAETVTHLIRQGDDNLELRFDPALALDTDTLRFDLWARDKGHLRTYSFPK